MKKEDIFATGLVMVAVTVGLRASAPTYEKPAFAAVSGLSKYHSTLTPMPPMPFIW